MIPELRRAYNSAFTEERYLRLVRGLEAEVGFPIEFRISETPLFLAEALTRELEQAAWGILETVTSEDYVRQTGPALPSDLAVPGETPHPVFLQIDFALALDETGEVVPRLIELQGFPSLYGFQWLLDGGFRESFDIPEGVTPYFAGLDRITYIDRLREVIVSDCDPEQVILLEIDPELQKTRCDFAVMEKTLGIRTVCPRNVKERGGHLIYEKDGRDVPIRRIYNRVIFDELQRKGLTFDHLFRRDVRDLGAEWVGHPSWYFRISKYSLPFLRPPYAPETHFLSDLQVRREFPADLDEWVLKPLYSFAGLGVELSPSLERLQSIQAPGNYLLQKKVEYAPVVETPDGGAKAEVRMMFAWRAGRPELINNLVRMSKGTMMGVDFNKKKTWVGASLAYHPVGE
jgi:hypothetical protein